MPFLPLCIFFPFYYRTHFISPDIKALIIVDLHRHNRVVESRPAAAAVLWENPFLFSSLHACLMTANKYIICLEGSVIPFVTGTKKKIPEALLKAL